MHILGIGSDMCDIRRIEQALERFGERFEQRCFTETERAVAARRKQAGRRVMAGTYAKRFAAKEACSKALGTGFRHGVWMRDIGVVNLPTGQPTLVLDGGAARRLDTLTPAGCRTDIHLTLTDEYPYAQAWVMLVACNVESE